MDTPDYIDLAIVGAGWHGITMAKTYHAVYPDASIVILDYARTLGGTWAEERIYPSLKTNNTWGSYEFSDFPMSREKYGCQDAKNIPGYVMHQYLSDAARHFDVERTVRLGRKVEGVRMKEDDGVWEVRWKDAEGGEGGEGMTVARRLVLATGLTSEPFVPDYPGKEKFKGLMIHSKQLTARASDLAQAKNVVIVGGNKSGWDVAYSVARSGGKAHMLMRPCGAGPNYAWPRIYKFLGKTTSIALLSLTRFWTLFDPWPFQKDGTIGSGWLKTFLHKYWLGRCITALFWRYLHSRNIACNGFTKDHQVGLFAPWSSPYWMGGSLGTLNYDTDFFVEVKKGNIIPYHAELQSIDTDSVTSSPTQTISNIDAIIFCTGWKPTSPISISPPELQSQLGLATGSYPESIETQKLSNTFRQQILEYCPDLGHPPRPHITSAQEPPTPLRLYRFLIPPSPSYRNRFAVIGLNYSLQTTIVSQAQALWITAYFHDLIPSLEERSDPNTEDSSMVSLRSSAILHTTYETLRRPKSGSGFGEKHPDLVFDSLGYVDMLLYDLGLETKRKTGRGKWWREWFEAYDLRDYKGLVEEWKEVLRQREAAQH
ncbi:FAD-dependent monooxygenase DEP4 [Pseudocercospora fuligena]|uniref:FAD-dependent monooxygenase DEP4 n=1 Tax=Pseudocercospora fuligena TaxID=685502 RepID=A0A8H6VTL2_9PEZI|nr:FAD-dependent monooxygenase DEP4 [Pseudocercospora fuligena]